MICVTGPGLQDTERTVYLGNLSYQVTEGELRRFVAEAGVEVAAVDIPRDETGAGRGFAFVTLTTSADARRALDQLGGHLLAGRAVRVGRPQRGASTPGHGGPAPVSRTPTHLFIGSLAYDTSEMDLELHIAQVAPIAHVGLPRTADGRSRGVAFVTLQREEDIDDVIDQLNGVPFQGRPLRVERARARTG